MPDEKAVREMLVALQKRGPDDEGLLIEPQIALGHRRLSIIDLSKNGHQPMTDRKLGLTITYNGEIYNHRQLKAELLLKGYSFFSTSDTEVLLKAYHAWGDDFVRRLHGMFAFCIYDRRGERFVLGRDRLGIKPLYYVDDGDQFTFASNIQALKKGGVLRSQLSREALHYYLTFHSVVPAPHTIFEHVKKLEPGMLLILDKNGKKEKKKYWDVSFQRHDQYRDFREEEWAEHLLTLLKKSVKRRMVSDVPVGALLSGGLDSSLIVALMAELESPSLHTYSIGFENVGMVEGNEFAYSDLIAELFETIHHKIFIDSNRLLPAVQNCVTEMAEPMVSHDAVGFYLLSQEVSKEIKVVLCGQGADEIFAGYHWYPKIMNGHGDSVALYQQAFFDRRHEEVLEALQPRYHTDNVSLRFVQNHFERPGAEEAVDKALRLDTTVMLIDDPVKRVDNMTMAWGLEARVPFLDHELVEAAAAIPPQLKVGNGGKYILKKAAERVLPHEVIYRKKGYFPVPALKYLRGSYYRFAKEVLLSDRARQRAIFKPDYVEKLLSAPEQNITVLGGSKLWQLTLLEYWLQQLEV